VIRRSLCSLLLLSLCSVPSLAQQAGKVPYGGSEYFRFGLHLKNIQPYANQGAALESPQTSIIIIVGDTSRLQFQITSFALSNFLQMGGAVLIASDRSSRPAGAIAMDAGWASTFKMTITGEFLTAPPAKCYGQKDGRPFVRPLPGIGGDRSPFNLFKGVEGFGEAGVATDGPSELRFVGADPNYTRNALAEYAKGTFRINDNQPVAPGTMFAASLRPNGGAGRMIVVADQNVFSNGMMGFVEDADQEKGYRLDNGNWAFTNRTIDWLQDGFNRPRTHCLFIEDGRIVEKFAVELPRQPKPPIPDLPPEVIANIVLNNMNGIIDEAQEKDLFNRMLEGWLGFPRLVRWFLLVVTVVFLFTCARLLLRGRRKAEHSATISPQQQATLQPRGGVLRQRTAAQIEVGNLFEAASRRVRDRFNVLGGQSGPAGAIPPILIAADVRDGPILHRTVEWLWQIGYGDAPVNLPLAEWDRLNELLERVMTRAARGDWSFGQDV
jgi:hypothetical protein